MTTACHIQILDQEYEAIIIIITHHKRQITDLSAPPVFHRSRERRSRQLARTLNRNICAPCTIVISPPPSSLACTESEMLSVDPSVYELVQGDLCD